MLLKEYLTDNCENEQLAIIINNLADAAILISKTIKTINKISQSEVNKKSINVDGDLQKPLDIKSDEIIIDYLKKSPVAGYASEEQEGFIDFKNNNEFIVFADPLDGSSNIDVNVSIGTIFSIMPKNNLLLDKAFTQSGAKQKSSGFFVYGPQTTLFLTVGKGTLLFALDENIEMFVIINDEVSIPKSTSEFAINAAYKRYWNSSTAVEEFQYLLYAAFIANSEVDFGILTSSLIITNISIFSSNANKSVPFPTVKKRVV